uniref:NADH-ubiquinone oxidoreductase chain 2 n=1 Tax=Clinocottus analis TaxID=304258 RepID=D2DXF0_9TELE|nr:NADH dehydrogenase subunit 2 [Clinocottus analis]ACO49623.1 NADH dehydrogenase subunit 2 [Clinocottus analis]
MNPYILFGLLFTLGLGTTSVFASSHWLLAWMGLEMSTLAILPLMAQHHHPRAVEASTKYFLTQATAAAMLLFATTTNAWLTGQWNIQEMSHPFPLTLVFLALALKLGLAPLHSWLPEVLQGLDLTTGAILSTWQKLAPFALIMQLHPTDPALLITLGLTSTLVGGWGGLNQTQLRKILAYSSIAHLGWMVLVAQFCAPLTLLTLLLYLALTLPTFLTFKLNNATNINTLAAAWTKAPLLTALAPLLLLSLGGLPPLTGFMSKWLILQELTKQDLAAAAVIAALSALLSLYFYTRLSFAMTLTHTPNNPAGQAPWRLQLFPRTLPLALSLTLALFLLPLTPTLFTLVTP